MSSVETTTRHRPALALGVLLLLAASSAPAAAHDTYVPIWQARYPSSMADNNVLAGTGTYCGLCHFTPAGGSSWNAYGWSVRTGIQLGQSVVDAIGSAGSMDSDADPAATPNLAEILVNTQPGWTPGPNNTRYQTRGNTLGLDPLAGILGLLDPPPNYAYCFGDGSGIGCPCGNASAIGANAGCLNSFGTAGALLASGTPQVTADTLVLAGTGMTNSSAQYFQGTAQAGYGAGNIFGDGLRCASGTWIRLGTKTNVAGSSSYPVAGDLPISVRGAIPAAGGTRTYQVWYRNAAMFCTPETFNLTNGWLATWVP